MCCAMPLASLSDFSFYSPFGSFRVVAKLNEAEWRLSRVVCTVGVWTCFALLSRSGVALLCVAS